ncbi:MAG: DUF1501 domain-containing protein [Gammaproteobacteria bacterium]|nr:DUF1501 domain-containing protein [Gammaproteobacteria bacterium]
MNRRDFLKTTAMLGMGLTGTRLFASGSDISFLSGMDLGARAFDADAVAFNSLSASQVPRYINVFLYGGPSELAANLTNIEDISNNSQNAYPSAMLTDVASGGQITNNGFWLNAGGDIMESLLASGDMTVYRTMNRIKDDNKGHGASVTQNLIGSMDTTNPGIATTLAWILANNNPFSKSVDELLFPFVSFEGESTVFNQGNVTTPLSTKPISLNSNLQNPYQRSDSGPSFLDSGSSEDLALDALASSMNAAANNSDVSHSLEKRGELAAQIATMLDPTAIDNSIANYNLTLPVDAQITYENTNFGRRMKAAVSLALANDETVFISLGSGGLGGWDDHSEALDEYPARMAQLMRAVQAGIRHIEAAHTAGIGHARNIIINVYGDFGRNVNLNNSMGWDHGNNQNLFTFGGRNIVGRGLGKIVGATERTGTSGVNRQYTTPTATSYQFEPYALASSIYQNFGVTNPRAITGEDAIDESATGETLV